eukprot:scaffold132801_cov33-Phaeocystis_antarctica.AAC.1
MTLLVYGTWYRVRVRVRVRVGSRVRVRVRVQVRVRAQQARRWLRTTTTAGCWASSTYSKPLG